MSTDPQTCPNCHHDQHLPGADCDALIGHGPNRWHRCLCLARPGAALSCPPQMTCQGGTLGYADIWYLQHGHTLVTADGEVSPEAVVQTGVMSVGFPSGTPELAPAVPEAAPPTGQADGERARISAKLWEIAEHHIVAEWICCEPLEPGHTLCAKGYAALGMARTLLVDGDPKKVWKPEAPLLDAVLAEMAAAAEPHRLALSTALGLGTGAPWDAIRERAAELGGQGAARDRGGDEQDDIQVWPLARVLAEVRCGSRDWTWDEEWADLDRRHTETGYLAKLEQQIAKNGITMPVLIGSDGRLWDGHHRLRIAVRLCIPYVPVEITPSRLAAETPGPDTQGDDDTARLAKVARWVTSEPVTANTEFGNGYRACQRDIRDLIKGRFDRDPQPIPPAVVAEPGKENGRG